MDDTIKKRKLLTASEVASLWGVPATYVRDLYKTGWLNGIRFSKKTVKYREEEITRFEMFAENKDFTDPLHVTTKEGIPVPLPEETIIYN